MRKRNILTGFILLLLVSSVVSAEEVSNNISITTNTGNNSVSNDTQTTVETGESKVSVSIQNQGTSENTVQIKDKTSIQVKTGNEGKSTTTLNINGQETVLESTEGSTSITRSHNGQSTTESIESGQQLEITLPDGSILFIDNQADAVVLRQEDFKIKTKLGINVGKNNISIPTDLGDKILIRYPANIKSILKSNQLVVDSEIELVSQDNTYEYHANVKQSKRLLGFIPVLIDQTIRLDAINSGDHSGNDEESILKLQPRNTIARLLDLLSV